MKKLVALFLVALMAVSMVGCSLFSDDTAVKFEDFYTHKDPDGLKYDDRKVLINKDFGVTFAETVNSAAYPDTTKTDKSGNIVGIYDYNPETGLATGYTNVTTGEFVKEAKDLGKPDESMLISLKGDVIAGAVIYGNEDSTVAAYVYAFLTDKADKDLVTTNMENFYGITLKAESDTVLVCEKDKDAVSEQFKTWQENYGQVSTDRSATAYAENLKLELGLKTYGANPYKPCSEAKDPEDVEFDNKIVLTSSGAYSFADESLEKNMVARTDIVYGKEGKTVAHYTYYEYKSKEDADKLMNNKENNFVGTPERVSDTVIKDQLTGKSLQDTISAYIGYSVLQDDSLEGYATNLEGTYFAMRYEQ